MRVTLLLGAEAEAALRPLPCNGFQTAAWVQAVAADQDIDYRFCALAVERPAGPLYLPGALRHRFGLPIFEAMPLGGASPWLAATPPDAEAQLAGYRAALTARHWLKIALVLPPQADPALPTPDGQAATLHHTHLLQLSPDADLLFSRFGKHLQGQLRRSADHYQTERQDGAGAAEYHRVYRQGSARWSNRPPRLYGERFFQVLGDGGIADFWFARHQGQAVAAAVFLKGREEVFYFGSGLLDSPLKSSPMDKLMWQALRHYGQQGYALLNLGASSGLEGVCRFKEKFGASRIAYLALERHLPWLNLREARDGR